jgi:hypothetical protein
MKSGEPVRKLVPGVEIEMGGETYILPPLTIGQLRGGIRDKMRANDELIEKGQWWEALDIKNSIIAEALRRNYPDITDEDVGGMLDLRNYDKAWEIILGGSGLRSQRAREEADNAAINPTNLPPPNGILDPSTEPLLEPTDGPTKTSIN